MKLRKTNIIALLFTLIWTYPTSPVLYHFFAFHAQLTYMILILAVIFLVMSFEKEETNNHNLIKILFILNLIYAAIMLVAFLMRNEIFIIRDITTLFTTMIIVSHLNYLKLKAVVQAIIKIMAIMLFIGMLLSALAVISDVLSGSVNSNWNVLRLGLSKDNPILIRHFGGDFDYHMPYYLSVLPKLEDGSVPRFPIIFTEPTYCAFYVLPLLFLAFLEKDMRNRKLIILIFIIATYVSYSILGVLLSLIIPSYYLVFTLFSFGKTNGITIIGFVCFSLLLFYYFSSTLFGLFSFVFPETYKIIVFYMGFISGLQLEPFGYMTSSVDYQSVAATSFGNMVLFERYGYLGVTVFCLNLMYTVFLSGHFCKDRLFTTSERTCIISSVVISCVFMLKVPFSIATMPLVLTVYYSKRRVLRDRPQ